MRRDSNGANCYRLPTSVLVYCFRRKAGEVEYLMLRRTEKYGGFWQGVTGALERDESLQAGAARELREETGFLPDIIQPIDYSYSFPLEDEWKWAYHPEVKEIHEHVFLAEVADGTQPVLSFEHDAFKWSGFDRAWELLKWPDNRHALEVCHRLLCGSQAKAGYGQ